MADTKFTDASATVPGTLLVASWLNDVNTATYSTLSSIGGTANAITATGPTTLTTAYPSNSIFHFSVQATNTGAATLNINGLGVRNITKYGGVALAAGDLSAAAVAFVTYDGIQFQLINPISSSGRLLNIQTFTTNGTYTPTVGTTRIVVTGVGAGGGGGGTSAIGAGQVAVGGGGGAGASGTAYITSGFSGTTVTIGLGGSGVAAGTGNAGSTTSFGAFLVLGGGTGGAAGTLGAISVAGGAVGGAASGSALIGQGVGASGSACGASFAAGYVLSGAGGSSPYGGGGVSVISGGPATGGGAANGRGGGGAGSGGLGAGVAAGGGSGTSGMLFVYEYS